MISREKISDILAREYEIGVLKLCGWREFLVSDGRRVLWFDDRPPTQAGVRIWWS